MLLHGDESEEQELLSLPLVATYQVAAWADARQVVASKARIKDLFINHRHVSCNAERYGTSSTTGLAAVVLAV